MPGEISTLAGRIWQDRRSVVCLPGFTGSGELGQLFSRHCFYEFQVLVCMRACVHAYVRVGLLTSKISPVIHIPAALNVDYSIIPIMV